MNVLLKQCKNKKRKSHVCAVRAADMGLLIKTIKFMEEKE